MSEEVKHTIAELEEESLYWQVDITEALCKAAVIYSKDRASEKTLRNKTPDGILLCGKE